VVWLGFGTPSAVKLQEGEVRRFAEATEVRIAGALQKRQTIKQTMVRNGGSKHRLSW
jgi:hypothetical protein